LTHQLITLTVKGYFSEFLVSNIIGYLSFLWDQTPIFHYPVSNIAEDFSSSISFLEKNETETGLIVV